MMMDQTPKQQFDRDGRIWVRNAISDRDLRALDQAAAGPSKAGARLHPSDALGRALSSDGTVMQAVRRLDPQARPVRVVAFNKTPEANWGVSWHQDRVIAVSGRQDVAGYGNWTEKAGVWHCEPPQHILQDMLFVRVHLDRTDLANGAMMIAVGSHLKGVVPAPEAEACARQHPIEVCEAERGDVLILKMLTLHASKPAQVTAARRVLRLDFASSDLPAPMSWTYLDTPGPATA